MGCCVSKEVGDPFFSEFSPKSVHRKQLDSHRHIKRRMPPQIQAVSLHSDVNRMFSSLTFAID